MPYDTSFTVLIPIVTPWRPKKSHTKSLSLDENHWKHFWNGVEADDVHILVSCLSSLPFSVYWHSIVIKLCSLCIFCDYMTLALWWLHLKKESTTAWQRNKSIRLCWGVQKRLVFTTASIDPLMLRRRRRRRRRSYKGSWIFEYLISTRVSNA